MRIVGLDPGLRRTGWGVIDADVDGQLSFVGCGCITPPVAATLPQRLAALYDGLVRMLVEHAPDQAAVEETFVNCNPRSALRLGHARGIVLVAPALRGVPVTEYAARLVKQAVVGSGGAAKPQVAAMMRMLLPGCASTSADAADALAVAVCHAHHAATRWLWGLPA